jgi:hypothetical protein
LKNQRKTKLWNNILWRHKKCKKDAREENVVEAEEQFSIEV